MSEHSYNSSFIPSQMMAKIPTKLLIPKLTICPPLHKLPLQKQTSIS